MPLYDYVCQACGKEFEVICDAGALTQDCPNCGNPDAKRQISMPSPLKTGAFPYKPTGQIRPLNRGPCGGKCGI